jgi:hypothetical protein
MKVQLSKTVDIIHRHLPHLLKKPFPPEILAQDVCLVLFPSSENNARPTQIHGQLAYTTAFRLASWTAPLALNRSLFHNDILLGVLSERMLKLNNTDQLHVKWQIDQALPGDFLSTKIPPAGWFKFEFDEDGKVRKHIVESRDEPQVPERSVSVADWLMGKGSYALNYKNAH